MTRVAARLLVFVLELLKLEGVGRDRWPAQLQSVADSLDASGWVDWPDYLSAIELLGARAGADGIGRAMRAAPPEGYAELRSMYTLFQDPIAYFTFVNQSLMTELNPCVSLQVTALGAGRVRVTTRIADGLQGSLMFHEGTRTLVEIFPTHCGLAEAAVVVHSMNDRVSELDVQFPPFERRSPVAERSASTWASVASALTPRETEVMKLVCEGLTNAAIAATLGTSKSTVKNQLSTILAKLGVSNRTELAVLASRGP